MSYFKDIIGHEKIIDHFQTAIRTSQVSHAYILEGEEGSGKKMLAKAFAAALQCEDRNGESCGTCHSCMMADSGNHPDIIWVTHEKLNTISVDDIRRQINADIGIKPYSGTYKIYIVDQADKMNEQAQNALLKTIEEPPAYVVILLLAGQTGSFLPTILSRCITFTLKPVAEEKIRDYIMDHTTLSEKEAEFCAGYSMGNLGKAMALAVSEGMVEMRKECVHLLSYLQEMEIYEVICSIKEISKYKGEILEFLDMMMIWYHDVLVLKTTKSANKIVYKDHYNLLMKLSSHMSYEGIQNILYAFDKVKLRLRANVNFDVALELLLLTIKENIVW
ncbi:MAG: DNA polymerase III subunit delta' [Lachnospiraceae bacterium]|nr:DNA polymerase III subunit delta' [Lachnospiraceae bacterium]